MTPIVQVEASAPVPASVQADERLPRALAAIGRKVIAIRTIPGSLGQREGIELVLRPEPITAGLCERDNLALQAPFFVQGSPIDAPRTVISRSEFARSSAPAPPGKTIGPTIDCTALPPGTDWVTASSPDDYNQGMLTLDRLARLQARRDPSVIVSCTSMLAACADAQRSLADLLGKTTTIQDRFDGSVQIISARGKAGPNLEWLATARVSQTGSARVEISYRPPPLS